MIIDLPLISNSFFIEVENRVLSTNGSYFDIITEWAQENNIEIEILAKVIQKNLAWKARLQLEAEDLNLIKKTITRLPI